MKKFFKLLSLAACVFCMTACSSNDVNDTKKFDFDEASYKDVIMTELSELSNATDENILADLDEKEDELSEATVSLYNSWMNVREDVGTYVGVSDWDFEVSDEELVVTVKVDYSTRDAEFKAGFDEDGELLYSSFNPSYTKSELMSRAGLNTVIGMGVVFVVLYLISIIIGCFKYINAFEQSMKNKKESKKPVAVEAVDNTIAQIVQKEEEELVDDLELVAVIAAAIAAHTGTSTDGFVVRSIKKSNRKKWLNA